MSLTLAPPCAFGRYHIERELGGGGWGVVYLARDTYLGRSVALKVPHAHHAEDPRGLKRFQREAHVAARINHPNVCPVLDVGEIDGTHFLTMPLIEGTPLARAIDPERPWEVPPAVDLVRQVALALDAMHHAGAIHRDLKPDNIMLKPGGAPVIMDFGLAWEDGDAQRLTLKGEFLGTPAYMSPEQVNADPEAIGARCDVYSLGVILYQLLTGKVPFQGKTIAAMFMQIMKARPDDPSALRPGLDPELDVICQKALAKKPEDRYASMADLAADLDSILQRDRALREARESRRLEEEQQHLQQLRDEVKQERTLRREAERQVEALHESLEAFHRLYETERGSAQQERLLREEAERRLQEALASRVGTARPHQVVTVCEMPESAPAPAAPAVAAPPAGSDLSHEELERRQRDTESRFDILLKNAQEMMAAGQCSRSPLHDTVHGRPAAVTMVDNRPNPAVPPPPAEPATSPEDLRELLLRGLDDNSLRGRYLALRTPELWEADCEWARRRYLSLLRWTALVAGVFLGELVAGVGLVALGLTFYELTGGLVGACLAAAVCGLASWKLIQSMLGASDRVAEWAELGPLPSSAYWLPLPRARRKFLDG